IFNNRKMALRRIPQVLHNTNHSVALLFQSLMENVLIDLNKVQLSQFPKIKNVEKIDNIILNHNSNVFTFNSKYSINKKNYYVFFNPGFIKNISNQPSENN